jgi:hypothetical protein
MVGITDRPKKLTFENSSLSSHNQFNGVLDHAFFDVINDDQGAHNLEEASYYRAMS